MNPEEYIPIRVDILLLKKYFEFQVITKGGIPCENWSIKRKYYDQVKDLLSEYGILDQQTIDNFCFLEMIFWGQYSHFKKLDTFDKVEEDLKIYYSDLSKLGSFLEEYNIQTISFKGNSKTLGARKANTISLNEPQIISEALEGLSRLTNLAIIYKEKGIFESERKKPGAEVKPSGIIKRELFFNLLKFLNTLPFPVLNDLSETNENYFAGRLFSIAGSIDPFPEASEDKTAYKSPKDYYVKRMKRYR